MKNNLQKIIVLFIFLISFFGNQKVFASNLILKTDSLSVGTGQQFFVDIFLDTEGKKINGIEGSVSYDKNTLSFVRAEEGSSIISPWLDKPYTEGNKVKFSGIIPNGFDGVIDPFDQNNKLAGKIIRLIFQSEYEGDGIISTSDFYTTLNDGLGTIDNINPTSISIKVNKKPNPFIYKTESDSTPVLSAYITRDTNLFNGKYVLIFDASDIKTGIKEVRIKEGRRDWKSIESPYLLEDQSRHSIITLQANNYSGASISLTIESLPHSLFSIYNISILLISLVVCIFIVKKIYEKYKKSHN